MIIDSILAEFEDYNTNYNAVKDLVLSKLYRDKIITKSQYETYCFKWNIIIVKKTWFKSWAERFFPKETGEHSSDYVFKYVRFEE